MTWKLTCTAWVCDQCNLKVGSGCRPLGCFPITSPSYIFQTPSILRTSICLLILCWPEHTESPGLNTYSFHSCFTLRAYIRNTHRLLDSATLAQAAAKTNTTSAPTSSNTINRVKRAATDATRVQSDSSSILPTSDHGGESAGVDMGEDGVSESAVFIQVGSRIASQNRASTAAERRSRHRQSMSVHHRGSRRYPREDEEEYSDRDIEEDEEEEMSTYDNDNDNEYDEDDDDEQQGRGGLSKTFDDGSSFIVLHSAARHDDSDDDEYALDDHDFEDYDDEDGGGEEDEEDEEMYEDDDDDSNSHRRHERDHYSLAETDSRMRHRNKKHHNQRRHGRGHQHRHQYEKEGISHDNGNKQHYAHKRKNFENDNNMNGHTNINLNRVQHVEAPSSFRFQQSMSQSRQPTPITPQLSSSPLSSLRNYQSIPYPQPPMFNINNNNNNAGTMNPASSKSYVRKVDVNELRTEWPQEITPPAAYYLPPEI